MKDESIEDELEMLNRLSEQLHQESYRVLGSIVLNVYKDGSQHVDTVQTQNITFTGPEALSKGRREKSAAGARHDGMSTEGGTPLPEALSTEAAMKLWAKVRAAGYVDDDFRPTISRSQSALLADAMAVRLGIKEKWKVFEELWQRRNMYRDYHDALDQRQSLLFRDKLKALLR
ncbi:MAG: hypothetical protein IJJ94_07315 [Bacteroidaceae bacterium]|nr:hypothetical protein [Bacteroidaceae bacterium]